MQIGWNKMVFRKQNEPVQLTAQNTIQMWLTFLKKKKVLLYICGKEHQLKCGGTWPIY